MNYKSYGSFAPIYTEAIHQVYEHLYPDRARQAENVLRRVAEHASPIGTCWPSIERLRKVARYGFGTVKRAVIVLTDELDYIRFHVEENRVRRRLEITWQINPHVLYIAPTYILDAESLWNQASKGSNVIFKVQPESEPESEAESEPEKRTKTRTTTTSYESSKARKPTANTPAGKARKNAAQTSWLDPQLPSTVAEGDESQQRAAQPQNAPPSSAPPPPSLAACRDALRDGVAEALANELASRMATRVTQSRQLVLQFGAQHVQNGMMWIESERERGRDIRNPFGLLKWWLEMQALTTDEKPIESLAGIYQEMFKK